MRHDSVDQTVPQLSIRSCPVASNQRTTGVSNSNTDSTVQHQCTNQNRLMPVYIIIWQFWPLHCRFSVLPGSWFLAGLPLSSQRDGCICPQQVEQVGSRKWDFTTRFWSPKSIGPLLRLIPALFLQPFVWFLFFCVWRKDNQTSFVIYAWQSFKRYLFVFIQRSSAGSVFVKKLFF